MFDINDPHQDFKTYDDNNVFENAWTMDKIKRKDGPVWVMNHFFVNPDFDLEQELDQEMPTALLIAKKSHILVWPLDPIVIRYFKTHPDFHSIWYHAPY